MKTLFFLVQLLSISICLSAQKFENRNLVREFSLKDTNYIYIGVNNRYNLDKEKLGVIRINNGNPGISIKLDNTYLEVTPKYQGFFSAIMETSSKKYRVLFVAKRISPTNL